MDAAITAVGLIIVALIGAYSAWLQRDTRNVVKDTHAQVVTLNESTIGELAAADETRRAQRIAHDERTAMEQRHIDTAPAVGPAQGPRLADRLKHVEEVAVETHHAVNGDPPNTPSLYELVQGLVERLERMETNIYGPRGG